MLSKADLEALANARIQDAILLLQNGRSSSAYYLSGYAVEFALKACIAKAFQANAIPDKEFVLAIYKHKLSDLVGTAGLVADLRAELAADQQFAAAWGVANNWSEQSRYALWDQVAATTMVGAISDAQHGVLQWVKRYW